MAPIPQDLSAVSQNLLEFDTSDISELERMLYSLMSKTVLQSGSQTDIMEQIQQLKQYAQGYVNAQNVWENAYQRFERIWNAHLPQE